jgi:hypothetical protein
MYARWQHVEIVYKKFCYNIIFHDVFPFYKLRHEYEKTWLMCQGYILWYEMSENKSTALCSDNDSWLL